MAEKRVKACACSIHSGQVMPELCQKNVIILCDSWYVKKNLVSIVDEYPNLDLIGNARSDSVIYDLAPAPMGKRGRRNQTFVFQHGFSKPATVFFAWQEKAPLNQSGSSQMQYIPLFLYSFRWNIEVSYYEQKFYANLVQNIETYIKSNVIAKVLKQLCLKHAG